jgi:transposase
MPATDFGGVSAPRFQNKSPFWSAGMRDDARIGIETGAMTPWLVHELRNLGLEVVCAWSTNPEVRVGRRYISCQCGG